MSPTLEQTAPIGLHVLAVQLGLPWQWLRVEALAGRIPALKVGSRLLFSRRAVEAALLERAATARVEGANHA